MNIFLKSRGRWYYLKRVLSIVLAIGMILFGMPIGVFAQKGIPARIQIVVDPFPQSEMNLDPEMKVTYKAVLYDKKGYVIDPEASGCGRILFKYVNPLHGKYNVIKSIESIGAGRVAITIGPDRGPAQLNAYCEKKPDIIDRHLVSGTGGLNPFEASEIRFWLESPPPPLVFSKAQREYLEREAEQAEKEARAKAEIKPAETPAPTPAEPAPGEKAPTPTTKAGPDIGTALLIGGLAVGAAALIGAAAGGLGGYDSDGDGGSGGICSSGYAPCPGYNVCCRDLYRYCPSTGGCCSGFVYGWASCCGKYEAGVLCHW